MHGHRLLELILQRGDSYILQAVHRGDFAALVLLDLSAAFDTVDHEILIQRLDKYWPQDQYLFNGTIYR